MKKLLVFLMLNGLIFIPNYSQNYEWVRFISPVDNSTGRRISDMTLDTEGNIYVLGEFDKNSVIGSDTLRPHRQGHYSCYIAKFSPDSSLQWIRSFGSKSYDYSGQLEYFDQELYATAFLQGDTVFVSDTFFIRPIVENGHILKFSKEGEFLNQKSIFDRLHITALKRIDTLLFVSSGNTIKYLDRNLSTQGSFSFGTRVFVNIDDILNIRDTAMIVAGSFGGNINYAGLEIPDTLTGSGYTRFLAALSSNGDLQWMKSFGRTSDKLHLVWPEDSPDFYLAGTFIDAFRMGPDLLAPIMAGRRHAFVSKIGLDGEILLSRKINPNSTSGSIESELIMANNNHIFLGGSTIYTDFNYELQDTVSSYGSSFGYILKLTAGLDFIYGTGFGPRNFAGELNAGVISGNQMFMAVFTNQNGIKLGCDIYEPKGSGIFLLEDSAPDDTPDIRFSYRLKRDGNLIITNTNLGDSEFHYWDFGDGGDPDSVSINPVHSYKRKGEMELALYAGNKCGVSKYSKKLRLNGLGSLNPNFSGDRNLYVGQIKGIGFSDSAVFRLVSSTGYEKEIRSFHYIDSSTYNMMVEFNDDPKGHYSLLMENGEEKDTLENTLFVTKSSEVEIECRFVGPPQVLSGREFEYTLEVENMSSETAYGVPVSIIAPAYSTIIMDQRDLVSNEIIEEWLNENHGNFVTMNTGRYGSGYEVATFLIPVLPGNRSAFLNFFVSSTLAGPGRVRAFYHEPIFRSNSFFEAADSTISGDSLICPGSPVIDELIELFGINPGEEAGFDFSNLGCILYSYLVELFGSGSFGGSGYGGGNSPGTFLGGANAISMQGQALNLGPLIMASVSSANPGMSHAEVLKEYTKISRAIPPVDPVPDAEFEPPPPSEDAYSGEIELPDDDGLCEGDDCLLPLPQVNPFKGVLDCVPYSECLLPLEPIPTSADENDYLGCDDIQCPDLLPIPKKSHWQMLFEAYWEFVTLESLDPNEKYPIKGSDENNYLLQGRKLNYHITFENADSATAPASEVFVYDTLDLSVLDTTDFKWNSFGFADHVITLDEEGTEVIKDVDLRPFGGNILVRFHGRIDSSGILSAVFTSLDTLSYALTQNVLDGFLLPNVSAPEGEGFFNFSIGQKEGLGHGTRIENRAGIIFDRNEVIMTGTALNTIDTIHPVSQVQAFENEVSSDSIIRVVINGSDAGSGIRGYNIYVKINDSNFALYARNYSLDVLEIIGSYGNTYSFFSQAVDNVGLLEEKNLYAEATISLEKDTTPVEENSDEQGFRVYPNPANQKVNITFPASVEGAFIELMEYSGKVVKSFRLKEITGDFHFDVASLVPGVYFLSIQTVDQRYTRSLIIQ